MVKEELEEEQVNDDPIKQINQALVPKAVTLFIFHHINYTFSQADLLYQQ